MGLARQHACEEGLPLLLDIERAGAQVRLSVAGYRLPTTDPVLSALAQLSKDGRAEIDY